MTAKRKRPLFEAAIRRGVTRSSRRGCNMTRTGGIATLTSQTNFRIEVRLPTRHAATDNPLSCTTMSGSAPRMDPYARHILVCTGSFCSPDRRGRELYALLPGLLDRAGLLFGPDRVKRGETPCLGVCAGGPIVVVYPEGVWYAAVTAELLARIVDEHLKRGQVIEEAVFHRLADDPPDRKSR